jgi:hypothetical protein
MGLGSAPWLCLFAVDSVKVLFGSVLPPGRVAAVEKGI